MAGELRIYLNRTPDTKDVILSTDSTCRRLSKSYKRTFPFSLATTSFIYPDTYAKNVEMLGPYVDEIELLMFESDPAGLPSASDIHHLETLAREFDLVYNVHLPYDVSLADSDQGKRYRAIDAVRRVMDLTAPLCPTTYTLHLPYDDPNNSTDTVQAWQDRCMDGVARLLSPGGKPSGISVETLDYPFEWFRPVIETLGLSVCLDVGHLMLYEMDLAEALKRYKDRTAILHIHGVKNGRDHLALNQADSRPQMDILKTFLPRFKGTVSIEVFSYPHLAESLPVLKHLLAF